MSVDLINKINNDPYIQNQLNQNINLQPQKKGKQQSIQIQKKELLKSELEKLFMTSQPNLNRPQSKTGRSMSVVGIPFSSTKKSTVNLNSSFLNQFDNAYRNENIKKEIKNISQNQSNSPSRQQLTFSNKNTQSSKQQQQDLSNIYEDRFKQQTKLSQIRSQSVISKLSNTYKSRNSQFKSYKDIEATNLQSNQLKNIFQNKTLNINNYRIKNRSILNMDNQKGDDVYENNLMKQRENNLMFSNSQEKQNQGQYSQTLALQKKLSRLISPKFIQNLSIKNVFVSNRQHKKQQEQDIKSENRILLNGNQQIFGNKYNKDNNQSENNIQKWINRTGSGFYKSQQNKLSFQDKYLNLINNNEIAHQTLEEKIFESLKLKLKNKQIDYQQNIDILKDLVQKNCIQQKNSDILNKMQVNNIEVKIFKEFIQQTQQQIIVDDINDLMKIPKARAQINKINGINQKDLVLKNEINPYHEQEVIQNYVNKFKNETLKSQILKSKFSTPQYQQVIDKRINQGMGRSTGLYIPGFEYDPQTEYMELLKRYNQSHTSNQLKRQIQIKSQNSSIQRREQIIFEQNYVDQELAKINKEDELAAKIEQDKKIYQRQLLIEQKKENREQRKQQLKSQINYQNQINNHIILGMEIDQDLKIEKNKQYKKIQIDLKNQIKQQQIVEQENQEKLKKQELDFLHNIGLTNKTNQILHLKSKILKQRYRDQHISKDLDQKAWADLNQLEQNEDIQKSDYNSKIKSPKSKAIKGTIFNQFYTFNQETSPVKQLPPNWLTQVQNLEKIQKDKIDYENAMIEQHKINKIDEFDQKVREEKDLRFNIHKRIQSSNKLYDKERSEQAREQHFKEQRIQAEIDKREMLKDWEAQEKEVRDVRNKAYKHVDSLKEQVQAERVKRKWEFIDHKML